VKKLFVLVLIIVASACLAQDDTETYLKVEKARAEVPSCRKLLSSSQTKGSVPLLFMAYADLDKAASQLTHCGFVFRMTGDTQRGEDAGNESDRYDAAIGQQMQRYLKAKNLWEDFLKQDCRQGSSKCGTN
jgi:hypothetical protein